MGPKCPYVLKCRIQQWHYCRLLQCEAVIRPRLSATERAGPRLRGPVHRKFRNNDRSLMALAKRIFTDIPQVRSDRVEYKPRTTMDTEETLQQRRRRLGQVARAVGSKLGIM